MGARRWTGGDGRAATDGRRRTGDGRVAMDGRHNRVAYRYGAHQRHLRFATPMAAIAARACAVTGTEPAPFQCSVAHTV